MDLGRKIDSEKSEGDSERSNSPGGGAEASNPLNLGKKEESDRFKAEEKLIRKIGNLNCSITDIKLSTESESCIIGLCNLNSGHSNFLFASSIENMDFNWIEDSQFENIKEIQFDYAQIALPEHLRAETKQVSRFLTLENSGELKLVEYECKTGSGLKVKTIEHRV